MRDLALAHVLCVELLSTSISGKRFFIVAGKFCNKDIVHVVAARFPELRCRLPKGEEVKRGMYPEGRVHGFDNLRSGEVLGLGYRGLRRVWLMR